MLGSGSTSSALGQRLELSLTDTWQRGVLTSSATHLPWEPGQEGAGAGPAIWLDRQGGQSRGHALSTAGQSRAQSGREMGRRSSKLPVRTAPVCWPLPLAQSQSSEGVSDPSEGEAKAAHVLTHMDTHTCACSTCTPAMCAHTLCCVRVRAYTCVLVRACTWTRKPVHAYMCVVPCAHAIPGTAEKAWGPLPRAPSAAHPLDPAQVNVRPQRCCGLCCVQPGTDTKPQ